LTTREKTLNAIDDAALSLLLPLQKPSYDLATVDEFTDYRKDASLKINRAMVLIRLLYGNKILEQFRDEVSTPITHLFAKALHAKTSEQAMKEYQNTQNISLLDMAKKIDDWEKKIAELPLDMHF